MAPFLSDNQAGGGGGHRRNLILIPNERPASGKSDAGRVCFVGVLMEAVLASTVRLGYQPRGAVRSRLLRRWARILARRLVALGFS